MTSPVKRFEHGLETQSEVRHKVRKAMRIVRLSHVKGFKIAPDCP